MNAQFWESALIVLACVTMLALLAVLLIRYFLSPFGSVHAGAGRLLTQDCRPTRRNRSMPPIGEYLLFVLALFATSRLMFILLGGVAVCARTGSSFFDYLRSLTGHWIQWDARHYLALAEDWYVNTGDERLKLVFYPLYPAVVRAVNLLFRNTVFSAFLVSNLALIGSGLLLYRVVAQEMGATGGRRAVFFLMFCPLSFYFSVPYTESMFLLTTLAAVDFARRRRWPGALLMGALSALTRSLGLLTAVCIFYEMMRDAAPPMKGRPVRMLTQPAYLKRMGLSALLCCTVALGFGAYLLLNYQVSGDPFRFLEYQSSNWSQEFGSLRYTISYSFENALSFHNEGYRTGVWIPQLLYLFGVLAILLACCNRIRPGYGAYALLYTYVAYAPTWLLSGPRYLTAMFALYPMLAALSRRRWAFILLAALSLIGCGLMTWQCQYVGCLL